MSWTQLKCESYSFPTGMFWIVKSIKLDPISCDSIRVRLGRLWSRSMELGLVWQHTCDKLRRSVGVTADVWQATQQRTCDDNLATVTACDWQCENVKNRPKSPKNRKKYAKFHFLELFVYDLGLTVGYFLTLEETVTGSGRDHEIWETAKWSSKSQEKNRRENGACADWRYEVRKIKKLPRKLSIPSKPAWKLNYPQKVWWTVSIKCEI